MTGSNLLVMVLALGVSVISIVITTTVTTETSVSLSSPIELSSQVEGDMVLDNCEVNCNVHYQGSINVSLTQAEINEPFKIESDFTMESMEVIDVVSSVESEVV